MQTQYITLHVGPGLPSPVNTFLAFFTFVSNLPRIQELLKVYVYMWHF